MSEKPTTEAPSAVQSAVAAVARLIPGADPSKSKSKKKKGKPSQAGSGAVTPAPGQVTTAESTETAKVAEAPSKEELPSDLVADKKEIEKELKEDAEKEKAQGNRPKSAAEDLVCRRIKLISKKIQRMASYKDREASLLNPDQTAALKTLPGLEFAQKELEDILKALENIERDAEAKRREESEGSLRNVESAKAEAVQSYKSDSLPLISSLLAIHASLHPQDTSSSFIPPQLPAHLQDVPIEDVRTVDGLYAKLKDGESIDAVIGAIKEKEGSSAYDLITGKSQSNVFETSTPSVEASETEDLVQEVAGDAAALGAPISDQVAHEPSATFEQSPQVVETTPKAINESQGESGPGMSFLQSSELEEPSKESFGVKKEVASEDSDAHELAPTIPEIPSTNSEAIGQTPGAIDWADDDETTSQADIDALRKQFGMPVEAVPEAIAVAPSMPVIDPSARPGGLPPIPAHARGGAGRGRGRIGGPAGNSGNWRKSSGPPLTGGDSQSQVPFSQQNPTPQQPREQREPNANGFGQRGRGGFPHHGPPHHGHQQGPPGEDDGFQSVSRRRGGPPPGGPPGMGGRGGGFGGRGRGGPDRGGRGGPHRGGRGAQGANSGDARPPQAAPQASATPA